MIYRLTGTYSDEIEVEALDGANVLGPYAGKFLLSTGIKHYDHGNARVYFFGPDPYVVSFTLWYEGSEMRLALDKCDGFAIIGAYGGAGHDWVEVHGNVRGLKVEEYISEHLFQRIY